MPTENGVKVAPVSSIFYRFALDNYEPTREYVAIPVEHYTFTDGRNDTWILRRQGNVLPRDAEKAVYVLDDGTSVRVLYVAGWEAPHKGYDVYLQEFPVNPEDSAQFRTWQLGPRRLYHGKAIF